MKSGFLFLLTLRNISMNMERNLKKTLKITAITLCSLLIIAMAAIAIAINFIFTPAKLTPIVNDVANKTLNAHLDMKSVELTFFSTFPKFGLKVTDGALVSKVINDTLWCKEDSLLSFKECIVTVNPLAYFTKNKISIHNISIEKASVYAFKNEEGKSNWDVMKADTTTIDKDSTTSKFSSDIDIKNIELKNSNLVFDDRDTHIYARVEDTNLKLKASLTKENSSLYLKLDNKNILFWQEGELLVNRIKTSMTTDIAIDRKTRTWTLKDTELTINGIKLDVQGTVVRDTVAKTLDMDIRYGLDAPSVETVLNMIPESIVMHTKVSAKGEVKVEGTLKGIYGEKKIPVASLKIQIKDASAKYADLPYGIDNLVADFEAYIDLMRQQPSYLNLKIFRFKGAHTDVLADAKVEDLLTDPLITFNTKSVVDLDALAKTFPLQEGVSITGKLNADLGLKCRLSSIKKQDIGRIKLWGKLDLNKFTLKDSKKDFDFSGDATFDFKGNNTFAAQAEIRRLTLKSKRLSSTIEKLSADITSTNPKDTTHIVNMKCNLGLEKLKASIGDSISLYSGKTTAKITLESGKLNADKPLIYLSLETDSMFFRINKTKLGIDVGGFAIEAEKVKDSVWMPRGIIGFNKLFFSTPEFGLPIRMRKTSVTLKDNTIRLKNASMRIGKSNLVASGSVQNLYKAIKKNEIVTAHLDISSNLLDCNQLINALSFPEDSLQAETDSVPTDLKLFIIPKNIDFELQTDIKKVIYEKMIFENVHGAVDVKKQSVYLKDLSMKALDAEMKTTMVYKSTKRKNGYVGFDFKIKDINVAKLVDFIPSLDTIVPMLRSFKGYVNFDVAAEAVMDSTLNLKISSLKSAIHIKGDSLVLMDGETFAEISKMLMFKNKKHNVFDSISVNITVRDGNVIVYPFLVEIDRYKAAIGGQQGLDMNLNYHISILKSPLPFKAGINISGNIDKMNFKIGKAKYKNAVTPAEIHKVDSTRMNMGQQIIGRFRRIMR